MVFARFKTVAFAVFEIIVAEYNVVYDGVLKSVTLLSALIFLLSSFAEQILTCCLFLHFTHE